MKDYLAIKNIEALEILDSRGNPTVQVEVVTEGGFSGIATIIYYLFKVPMGTTILAINIPLFLFATVKIGRRFLEKSIIGTISLSVFIDILDRFEPLTNDKILACIYGGILTRIGNSTNFRSTLINRRVRFSRNFNKRI